MIALSAHYHETFLSKKWLKSLRDNKQGHQNHDQNLVRAQSMNFQMNIVSTSRSAEKVSSHHQMTSVIFESFLIKSALLTTKKFVLIVILKKCAVTTTKQRNANS